MATGKSGYLEFSSNVSWGTVRVYWSETYDIATNKSTVTITSIKVRSTNWSSIAYYLDGILKINGTAVATFDSEIGTAAVQINAQDSWYDVMDLTVSPAFDAVFTTSLKNIAHNNDGSKSISIELTGNRFTGFRFFTISGESGNGWYVDDNKTITLTTIPRASTIGASDANIGSKSTIIVTRMAESYTHSIAFSFGTLSGYITASGGISNTEEIYSNTTISWTIPESFYEQLKDDWSGICTLTIRTYLDTTQIGDAQTGTLRVSVAKATNAPDVSGTVIDTNETTKALTGDENKLIRYCSTALCTITAVAKNGASITMKKIGDTVVTGNTRSIPKIGVSSVAFYAKDSREYSTSVRVSVNLIPYVLLTNNAVVQRTDPVSGGAQISVRGDYFDGSFGTVDNEISIKYRYRKSGDSYGSYTIIDANISNNTYSANVDLSGLHYEDTYEFEIIVSDKLSTVTKVVPVQPGIPTFDWGKNDFRFNVPVYLPSGVAISAEDVQALLENLVLESGTAVFG